MKRDGGPAKAGRTLGREDREEAETQEGKVGRQCLAVLLVRIDSHEDEGPEDR